MSAAVSLCIDMVSAGCCWQCGVPVYIPRSKYDACQKDHSNNFFCSNGHSAVFAGKTEAQKLREQLEAEQKRTALERSRREAAERQASAARGQVTKIKNRVGNGVCPCCNRTFQNLLRHMKTKHPDFKDATE